jgi:hypothetical protein
VRPLPVRGARGFTLAGLLAGAVAAGLAATAAASLLAAHARLQRAHGVGLRAAEVARTGALVLAAETRLATPADLVEVSADTLALRAVRGVALACAAAGADLLVRYRGLRLPEPDKDSVLVLGADGGERAVALEADRAAATACPSLPGEAVRAWTVSAAIVGAGDALLLFERGSYHLADGALRYRRGAGGRQPLTETFLASGAFALGGAPAALTVSLAVAPGGAGPGPRPPLLRRRTVLLWNWPDAG